MKNIAYLSVLSLSLFQGIEAYAYSGVKFYASNNSANNLTMQMAYDRLIGEEQIQLNQYFSDLISSFINENYPNYSLQKFFQETSTEFVLGTYHVSTTHDLTADNSIVFELHDDDATLFEDSAITKIAQTAAKNLNQDSVAIFEENPEGTSENIIVNFKKVNAELNYKLKDLDQLIKDTLPIGFSNGYSVTLNSQKNDPNVDDTYVTSIEWLGPINKFSVDSINQIKHFKNVEGINIKTGDAFYVYQNGHKEIIL